MLAGIFCKIKQNVELVKATIWKFEFKVQGNVFQYNVLISTCKIQYMNDWSSFFFLAFLFYFLFSIYLIKTVCNF